MDSRDRRRSERRRGKAPVSVDRRKRERRTGDRRQGSRIPLELWMEEVAGDEVYFRRTGNLGQGGVYFDSAIPHPLGTVITLKFTLPGQLEMVVARGEVVSSSGNEDGLGMGVKFISIEGDGRGKIETFVGEA